MRTRRGLWTSLAAAAVLCGYASQATAQVIYYEDFADAELVPGTTVGEAEINEGIITFTDDSASARGALTIEFVTAIGAPLAVPTATFSFDIVSPVYAVPPEGPAPGNSFEMLIRAGIGTGGGSLQSAQQIAEAIAYRTDTTDPVDHTRGAYENNGQETIFMVVNNQDAPTSFTHPGDGSTVNMTAWQRAAYVFNHATETWGVLQAVAGFNRGTADDLVDDWGDFERVSIGTSSSGHQGGFAMDNVLVMEGITFERNLTPTGRQGDVDGDDDVDMDDFAIIRMNFQKAMTERTDGDLVNDDVVDFRDFRQWKNNAPAPVLAQWAALGVPEPSTVMLAGLALAGGIAAKRRRSSGR
jgi:hypothetical protein